MSAQEQAVEDDSIRDYELMTRVGKLNQTLTPEELKGAAALLFEISAHLRKKHFEKKIRINRKALVKTFEELEEHAMEVLYDIHEVTGLPEQ
jgi:hypothetical protein